MRLTYAVATVLPAEELSERKAQRLVPWAIGKCEDCGSTLCADVLPHRCDPSVRTYPTEYPFSIF